MAKKDEDGPDLVNVTKAKKAATAAARAVQKLKDERQGINEAIAEKRSALVTLGIPKKAFDMAMSYANMDPDQRRGFDVAYSIVREALGLPYDDQGDLFVTPKDKGEEAADGADAATLQ